MDYNAYAFLVHLYYNGMMNILFISRKFPPSTGGMELFAYDLYNALQDEADVKLVKWGGSNKWLPIVLPWLGIRAAWRLLKGGVDVIHAQDGVLAPITWLLARLFRKPYAVVIHGLDITHPTVIYQKCVVPFIRRADYLVCISKAAAAELIIRGVPRERVAVIPLAVHDDLYGKADRHDLHDLLGIAPATRTLLTVGRLVPRKGVAWFISEVLPQLVKRYGALQYLVIGTGDDKKNIEKAITAAKMKDHVRLLGKVPDDVRRAAYNGADVFVMPNINVPGDMEGFGLVLLEAALCARPIVAANTEGIADAIHPGKNGLLVPSGDAALFAEKITAFLADPEQAASFGGRSRAYTMQHFQWGVLAAQYMDIYRQLAPDSQNP